MKHIHIIGIAGVFMGGIARLAIHSGYKVTGCDNKIYPPMSTQLKELGIEVIEGFEADQIKLKPDLFVIGNIAKRGMPIIEAILNEKQPYASGPEWLYQNILQQRHVLAVTGSHGKTTTASMLAWVLKYAGYDPGLLIGGIPENFKVSAHLPEQSNFFVLEADEYDTAFFDKRSKFVHYRPNTLVFNNLEFDHADIFEDIKTIQKQFHHLIRMMPSNGQIIYQADEPYIKEVFDLGVWTPTVPFGSEQAQGYHVKSLENTSHFEVYFKDNYLASINWSLLGVHNQNNALAAIAAAKHIGIEEANSCKALEKFLSIKRRMEIKGTANQITVYDDFAHHPTAMQNTIAGLRDKTGQEKRIIAVLEPHSNTMKLGTLKDQLADALKEADQIFCYAEHVTWDASASLAPIAAKTKIEKNFAELVESILQFAKPEDHILVMSNGPFNNIHSILLQRLGEILP